ncbi:MAG TPA: alpha/beta hydrolase [Terriglobales bacterium]|nr:alpha/beta hydrolase [Terriglobales bacterium]
MPHLRPFALLTTFVLLTLALTANAANKKIASQEGFITTPDGARLYFQKLGSGKPEVIVPLHQFLYDDFKSLGEKRTIVFYDVRDRGRSSHVKDLSTITLQQDVKDLETVRQHFQSDKVSLIGYSYVGMMVMVYTLEHPERVNRVVQLGPVAMKWDTEFPPEDDNRKDNDVVDGKAWNQLQELKKTGWDKQHPKDFCEKEFAVLRVRLVGDQAKASQLKSQCDFENEWPTSLEPHFGSLFGSIRKLSISRDAVAKLQQPVLTVHGRKDRNAPYGAGKEWATVLPNARLVTLPNAAHQSWIDEPRVVEMADRFLSGDWPAEAVKPSSVAAKTAAN